MQTHGFKHNDRNYVNPDVMYVKYYNLHIRSKITAQYVVQDSVPRVQ